MKFFVYDDVNGEIMLNDEDILLIREFSALYDEKRNKTKEDKTGRKRKRAFKEFKFIYLFFDWGSPYFDYSESDKHREAFNDSELTEEEYNDPLFKEACRKYESLQENALEIRLLKAAMRAVEEQIFYLENVNLNERNVETGKPIFKSKDLIAEIKGCKDLISSLRELERQVKKGEDAENTLRGGAEAGLFD